MTDKHSLYINQLNQNLAILDKNLKTLAESVQEVARETMALQQAVISYMTEKGLIDGPEDARLLQKLHMRSIAEIDQQIAHRESKRVNDL